LSDILPIEFELDHSCTEVNMFPFPSIALSELVILSRVTFAAGDESTWQGQAREKAFSDAEARAAELAGLAGVELGAVQSVSEVIGAWPVAMTPESIMTGGFAPGELELSTRVPVTFNIQ
jgi:uncharacterized protein YggE